MLVSVVGLARVGWGTTSDQLIFGAFSSLILTSLTLLCKSVLPRVVLTHQRVEFRAASGSTRGYPIDELYQVYSANSSLCLALSTGHVVAVPLNWSNADRAQQWLEGLRDQH